MIWIDSDKLSLIDPENNPKYESFDEYVEANIETLLNHKVENINEDELSEHILDTYVYIIKSDISYHIEKLYEEIFRFICLPQIQSYSMKNTIVTELSYIESYMINDDFISYIKSESEYRIKSIGNYYRIWYDKNIDNIETADILIETYIDEIIRKYAVEKDLVNEYKTVKEEE